MSSGGLAAAWDVGGSRGSLALHGTIVAGPVDQIVATLGTSGPGWFTEGRGSS